MPDPNRPRTRAEEVARVWEADRELVRAWTILMTVGAIALAVSVALDQRWIRMLGGGAITAAVLVGLVRFLPVRPFSK